MRANRRNPETQEQLNDLFILMEIVKATYPKFAPDFTSRRAFKIILLRSMGKPYYEIARLVGCSSARVSQIIDKQLGRLQSPYYRELWPSVSGNEVDRLRIAVMDVEIHKRLWAEAFPQTKVLTQESTLSK